MREVRGGPVVDVHLRPQCIYRGLKEQSGMGGAGIGPDDVGRAAIVPGGDF